MMLTNKERTYIEKVDGKYAVHDINIPALKSRNRIVNRAMATPNSRHTALKEGTRKLD